MRRAHGLSELQAQFQFMVRGTSIWGPRTWGRDYHGSGSGQTGGDLAQRILRGEPANSIQVIKEAPNSYIFDMQELRRFNIPVSTFRQGAEFVNQPLHSRV